jgi:Domain of unknown function DUF29
VGKQERSEYTNHMIRVLLHIIKWDVQPERRGMSWWLSIVNGRADAERVLEQNPSLKPLLNELHAVAMKYARRQAIAETGIDAQVVETFSISSEDAMNRKIQRPKND